jgi:hypothetical protein
MKFSKYFQMKTKAPVQKLTAPVKLELDGQEPAMLYFGSSQKAVPYQQFQTYYQTTGMNSLWIMGGTSWTQYAMVPLGAGLTLAAQSPAGGYGNLYEIYPDGTLDMQGNFFYPLDQIEFYADKVGQHLLFFNIAGQPSNIVAVDVVMYQQPPAPPISGHSDITVSSSWLLGYDVFVDGIYEATEGLTGEADGVVSFQVPGNEYHTIDIEGDGFSFSDSRYFEAGWAYNLDV